MLDDKIKLVLAIRGSTLVISQHNKEPTKTLLEILLSIKPILNKYQYKK